MPTTLGFPYPSPADKVWNLPALLQTLAEGIDAHLRGAPAAQAWTAVAPPANFANVAGWPVSRIRKMPGLTRVRLELAMTRSVANLAAGATVVTLPAGYRPTAGNQLVHGVLSTGAYVQFTVATTGVVVANAAINVGVSYVAVGEISLD